MSLPVCIHLIVFYEHGLMRGTVLLIDRDYCLLQERSMMKILVMFDVWRIFQNLMTWSTERYAKQF